MNITHRPLLGRANKEWCEPEQKAREQAELSRNMAEAARDAAQQARKEAIMRWVEEQNRRIAAEDALRLIQADREQFARHLATETKEKAKLAESLEEARSSLSSLRDQVDLLDTARLDCDRARVAALDKLDREQTRVIKFEEQVNTLKNIINQMKAEIKVEINSRKQLEKDKLAMQKEVAKIKEDCAKEVEKLRSTLEKDLKYERAGRRRLEMGFQQALKEVTILEEKASKASANHREALRELEAEKLDRLNAVSEVSEFSRRVEHLEESYMEMTTRENQLQARYEAEVDRRTSAEDALRTLESEKFAIHEAMKKLAAERDLMWSNYAPERQRRIALEGALREAESSRREAKRAWRIAEQQLHELMAVQRDTEYTRLEATQLLLQERSARLLAQQALEVHGSDEAEGARLVLLDDMRKEQDALRNCQRALEGLKGNLDKVSRETDRLHGANKALRADLKTERDVKIALEKELQEVHNSQDVIIEGRSSPASSVALPPTSRQASQQTNPSPAETTVAPQPAAAEQSPDQIRGPVLKVINAPQATGGAVGPGLAGNVGALVGGTGPGPKITATTSRSNTPSLRPRFDRSNSPLNSPLNPADNPAADQENSLRGLPQGESWTNIEHADESSAGESSPEDSDQQKPTALVSMDSFWEHLKKPKDAA